MVKCAQCGMGWAPVVAVLRTTPPLTPALAPELVVPEPVMPEPVRAPVLTAGPAPVASPLPPASRMVLAGWVASVALLVLLVAAAYAWRIEVMQVWPESERAYALLGLTTR